MHVPWSYTRLAQHWALSCPQARQLWQALARARGQAAVRWREALWQCSGQPGVPIGTLLAHWTPKDVLTVLDTLRGERQLAQVTRVQIEERVLAQVDATGQWVGLPAAATSSEEVSDLAYMIERFWR